MAGVLLVAYMMVAMRVYRFNIIAARGSAGIDGPVNGHDSPLVIFKRKPDSLVDSKSFWTTAASADFPFRGKLERLTRTDGPSGLLTALACRLVHATSGTRNQNIKHNGRDSFAINVMATFVPKMIAVYAGDEVLLEIVFINRQGLRYFVRVYKVPHRPIRHLFGFVS